MYAHTSRDDGRLYPAVLQKVPAVAVAAAAVVVGRAEQGGHHRSRRRLCVAVSRDGGRATVRGSEAGAPEVSLPLPHDQVRHDLQEQGGACAFHFKTINSSL